ncbi:MAG: sigma 54-interacting transcriptional regulator [Spirochaetaceae bacterium]|nr:sigma 54-interacting transcriptional regulator [Spirochaetaceae bacterium]
MPFDAAALLAPPDSQLSLLYELSRLLNRHTTLDDALPPFVERVERALGAAASLAALSFVPGEAPTVLVAPPSGVAGSGKAGLARHLALPRGTVLRLGEGPLGGILERGVSFREEGGGERLLASPVLAEGSALGLLAFLLRQGDGDPAPGIATEELQALVERAAALLSEACSLRRRIGRAALHAEEGRRLEATAVSPAGKTVPASVGESDYGLVGRSNALREFLALVATVAPAESTVLLTGESGTGKELAARALHAASRRATGPFVAVNCAAIPESLVESELFGHERGAFTGAQALRRGRFELAEGGTIFLDEVAEMPLGLQAKLLRVIQERSFERVGGGRPIRADIRIVAATNRDLDREVREGRFREDLFFRLAVFPLRLPPLRERGGDVVLLADHFAEKIGRRIGKPIARISTPALDLLTSYHWPGNVRELENAIERAVLLSSDGVIHAYHLPPSLQSAESTGTPPGSTLDAALARLERELVVEALKIEGGNAAAASRRLGVTERRMGLALRRFGIDWHRFRTRK